MSELTFNKVAGAVLATGLVIVGLKEVSTGVFAPHPPAKAGYAIDVPEEAEAGGEAAEAPIDWGTVLPTADVKAGETVFAKCKSCHTVEQGGANGTGPNLWGVVGRKPAGHAGFAYSQPMQDLPGKVPVWDDEHISEFVTHPQKYLAGTKMTFVGLKKSQDRVNLVAYLRAHGGTLPIPAPNPVAVAAAPAEGAAPAPGAAAEGQPTATGATATPAATSGGPAGQGAGAPAPGAPAQEKSKTANPN